MIQTTLGFFVTSDPKQGAWDEVYYTNHSDPESALSDWLASTSILGLKSASPLGRRAACLATDCLIYYIRASLPGQRGLSLTRFTNFPGTYGDGNYGGDAFAFRLYTAPFGDGTRAFREVRLGGIPDSVIVNNVITPSFANGYVYGNGLLLPNTPSSNFLNSWNRIGGVIRYRTTSLGGPSSYVITGAAKPTQYSPIVLTIGRNTNWPDGRPGVLSVRGQPQLRGNWKIQQGVDTFHVVLVGSERVSAPANLNGLLTEGVWAGGALAVRADGFLTEHKLGKKKFQRRARRSPILIRH